MQIHMMISNWGLIYFQILVQIRMDMCSFATLIVRDCSADPLGDGELEIQIS